MRFAKRTLSILLCVAVLIGCFAVGTLNAAGSESVTQKRDLMVGGTYTLWPETTGTWTGSNDSVAYIDEAGIVHAVSEGVASLIYYVPAQPYTGSMQMEYIFTVTDYKLSETSLSLYAGATEKLTLEGADGTAEWSTNNSKVATVSSSGEVKAVAKGSAKITAKYAGNSYVCSVTVKQKTIKLNKTTATVTAGDKLTLKLSNASGKITWSTSNNNIATVTSKGVVTTKKKGSVTITAKYNKKSYKCKITVKAKPVTLSKTTATLTAGDKLTLKLNNASGTVTWSSSDKSIAAVTSKGVVTTKKKGSVTITAKYNKKSYKCKITVNAKTIPSSAFSESLVIAKGDKQKFTIKNATASKVKWSSKNTKVASVSSSGVITAKSVGATTVTAKYGSKSYKCSVRVCTSENLGTKSVTQKNNTATISKVKISFDPSLLKNGGKVTLKKTGGLPKLHGVAMNTYDFSLSGAKVSSNSVSLIQIPQKVNSDQMPIAAYFNEKSQKWEPVCCSYDNGKISIVADHFSKYGVAAVSKSKDRDLSVYNENTTMQKMYTFWVPSAVSISGEEALEIVAKTLKTKSVPQKCVEWGWKAFNDKFDEYVNWKTNLFGALGVSTVITDFINDYTASFGAIGFALAYVNAVKYAWEGNHQQAAYTAFNGFSGAVSAAVASKIGTPAISAACFAVTVISYALTEGYSQALSSNEKKWYNYYKYYYQHENVRKPHHWKSILKPILESKKNPADIQKAVETEVDKYVAEAWSSEWFAMYFYEATGLKFGVAGGLSESIQQKLSAAYKDELLNGDIELVYEWYSRKLTKDAENALEAKYQRLAKELNKEFKISFYDSSYKKGKTSKYSGWTVRWKNIPKGIKDKNNLKLTLNSKGQASTEYTLFAALDFKIKPTVELVNPQGKVVRTLTYKIKSDTTKVNVYSKDDDDDGAPMWRLTSTKTYSLGRYSLYPDGSTYDLGGSYTERDYDYKFTFKGNTITTVQKRLGTSKLNTCTHKASVSQPAQKLKPGQKYTLTETLELTALSEEHFAVAKGPQIEIKCSGVNPKHEDNPKYPWVVASIGSYPYELEINAYNGSAKVGDKVSEKTTFTIPEYRNNYDKTKLKSGDVFYIYLESYSAKCHNYIVYKYIYK